MKLYIYEEKKKTNMSGFGSRWFPFEKNIQWLLFFSWTDDITQAARGSLCIYINYRIEFQLQPVLLEKKPRGRHQVIKTLVSSVPSSVVMLLLSPFSMKKYTYVNLTLYFPLMIIWIYITNYTNKNAIGVWFHGESNNHVQRHSLNRFSDIMSYFYNNSPPHEHKFLAM